MPTSRIKKIRRAFGGQTTLEGALDAMAQASEERVLGDLERFGDLVVTIVQKLADFVDAFVEKRPDGLAHLLEELDTLESEADDHKQAITDGLATGGIFFIGRADLARLVASLDTVANYAVGAADRIAMRPLEVPPDFGELMVRMVEVDFEAVQRVRSAMGAMKTDFREALRIASEVDKIESRADDVFAAMYRSMFSMETDFKTFHQLKSIIERLESIADKCAENAQLIRHMALEYLESA